jgi:hypothetical protein
MQALDSGRAKNPAEAARQYNVSRRTLQARIDGTPAKQDTKRSVEKMTRAQEEELTRALIELDERGFGATRALVEEMANTILANDDKPPIGKNWVYRFIKRTPALKMTRSRPYDYLRALCENPEAITKWFDVVATQKAKYAIHEDDIYNFDETGFMMGKIQPTMIVTGTERKRQAKKIQPGNREWATLVACASSTGYTIPAFLILAAKIHLAQWYTVGLPRDTRIELSDSGWINTELALSWLDHFDKHTRERRKASHRLLIMDGHDTHVSEEFLAKCKFLNIVPVCMPAHSSHLLQPMDVSVFGPLKRAYSKNIEALARLRTTNVDKADFLEGLKDAIPEAVTPENVRSGFAAAGLVPLDPQRVLEKLSIRPSTPEDAISSGRSSAPWTPKTPRTAKDLKRHLRYVRERVFEHPNSSPTKANEGFDHLERGVELVYTREVLTVRERDQLREGKTRKERKQNTRRVELQRGFGMTYSEANGILEQMSINRQIRQDLVGAGGSPAKRGRRAGQPPRCGECREEGHTVRTCSKRQRIDPEG